MRLRVCEMDGGIDDRASFGSLLVLITGDEQFVVQVEPESFRIFTSVTVVDANTEFVIARCRRDEIATPADRVIVALQTGDRHNFIPVEIYVPVSSRKHRRTAQILVIKVFAGEAVPGTAGRMKRSVLDGHGQPFHQTRSLSVGNVRG